MEFWPSLSLLLLSLGRTGTRATDTRPPRLVVCLGPVVPRGACKCFGQRSICPSSMRGRLVGLCTAPASFHPAESPRLRLLLRILLSFLSRTSDILGIIKVLLVSCFHVVIDNSRWDPSTTCSLIG